MFTSCSRLSKKKTDFVLERMLEEFPKDRHTAEDVLPAAWLEIGSSDRVDQIFTKGAAGLKFTPSPRPPRALPSAADLTYFQIDRESTPAEWQFVEKSLSLAIRFNEKLIEGNIQGERELKLKVKTGGGQTATIQVTLFVVPQSAIG